MRRIRPPFVVLLLAAVLTGLALADDEAETPKGPSAGELAEAVLVGPEYKVAAVAQALEVLDEEARLRVLYEVRDQARVRGILDHAVVSDLSLKGVDLDSSLKALLEPWGVTWHVSEKLKAAGYQRNMVMLEMSGVSVTTVLKLLTEPHDIRALVRSDGVWLVAKDEGDAGVVPSPNVALRAKLDTTVLTLSVDHVKFKDVASYVQATADIDVAVDPRVADEVNEVEITGIRADDVPVRTLLNMLSGAVGKDVHWIPKDGRVVFTKRSLLEK